MNRREFLAAAAAPLVLGVAPALARPSGGTPLALVTADLESHVVAVDIAGGTVVRRRAHARRSAQHRERRRRRRARRTHRRRPADADRLRPARALGQRRARRAALRRRLARPRLAYVTDSGRHELAVVDLRGRRVVGRVRVRGACRHLGIDRAGSRLWVVLGNSADEIAVLSLSEPARPRVIGSDPPAVPRARRRLHARRTPRLGHVRETADGLPSTRQTASSSGRSAPTRRRSTSPSWATAPSSRAVTTPC